MMATHLLMSLLLQCLMSPSLLIVQASAAEHSEYMHVHFIVKYICM